MPVVQGQRLSLDLEVVQKEEEEARTLRHQYTLDRVGLLLQLAEMREQGKMRNEEVSGGGQA